METKPKNLPIKLPLKILLAFFFAIPVFFSSHKTVSATTYYVATNATCAGDSNNGLGKDCATANKPFKTIQKAINLSSSGDTIFVRSGIYREYSSSNPNMANIVLNKSGITLNAYENEKPIIDGSKKITSSWTVYSASTYQATVSNESINGHPRYGQPLIVGQVTVDDTLLTPAASQNSMPAGTFFQSGATLYLRTPGSDSPVNHNVGIIKSFDYEKDWNEYCLFEVTSDNGSRLSNITVSGFTIQNSSGYGFWANKIDNFHFINNTIRFISGNNGIRLSTDVKVNKNEIYHCVLQNYPRGRLPKNDPSNSNSLPWGGSMSFSSSSGELTENLIHDNHGEGLGLGGSFEGLVPSSNSLIQNNILHNNYSVQIYVHGGSNNNIDRNLVYNTDKYYDPNDPNGAYRSLAGISTAQESDSGASSGGGILENNIYTNNIVINTQTAFGFFCDFTGSGLKNNLIANNTFINSKWVSIWLGNEGGSGNWKCNHSNNKFINNLVYKEGGGDSVETSGDEGTVFQNDLFFNASGDQSFIKNGQSYNFSNWKSMLGNNGSGSFWSDPLFSQKTIVSESNGGVNASDGMTFLAVNPENYKLKSNSPAINAGQLLSSSSSYLSSDFAGNSRSDGSFDIGAYEFGSSSPPVTGDVNGDGIVDINDFLAALKKWGSCPNCSEDVNSDDFVNAVDLTIILSSL